MAFPKNLYGFTSLIGGVQGALDRAEIDGADLDDLDLAIGVVDGKVYQYWLDIDSGAAESSPDIIAPDVNAGDKRWILSSISKLTGNLDAGGYSINNLLGFTTFREGLILSPANSDGAGALQAPFCEWVMVSPGKIHIETATLTQATYAFITWTNLAGGVSQTAGTTYYVYACNNSGALVYRLHTDGTLTTVDAMDARKIGYFHNSPPNHPNDGAYNSEGDILMYSIFSDEEDKYEGMVDIGICKADIYAATLWWSGDHWFGDIGYQDYADGAEAKSAYNKNPGVYTSWYEYKKAFARVGKFMLNPWQWYLAGLGTPDPHTSAPVEGTEPCQIWNIDPYGRKPDNSVFGTFPYANRAIKTGTAPKAVSTRGCYNIIGNVWEWVDLMINDGKYNNDIVLPAQNYIDDYDVHKGLPIATAGAGVAKWHNDFFWINTSGLRAALRGGLWGSGADAGLFALVLHGEPSHSTDHSLGSRGGKL